MAEPDNMVLHLLREMREEMRAMRGELADVRGEVVGVRSEVKSLRADVASDLVTLEKRVSEQIVGLRRAVVEFHSTVVGHGMLISELDNRVRRLETAPSGSR